MAEDCDFNCPECKKNISDTYIKNQFICGLNNEMLQTDILAKAESLKTTADTIKYAEAFESAFLSDQGEIVHSVEVTAIQMSQHRKQKSVTNPTETSYNRQQDIRTQSFRDRDRANGHTWHFT